MTQTIYINARFLTQTITGVQLYARELCRYLQQTPDKKFILIAPNGVKIPKELRHLEFVNIGRTSGYVWEQVELPAYLKKQGTPLLINFCNTAPLLYTNQFVTIHDLAYMHHPQWFSKGFAKVYRFLIPKLIKRSLHIITVSQTIKNQIVELFGVPHSKISLIYNGLQADMLTANHSHNIKEKLIFAVSSINPRKNLEGIIRAFKKANLENYHLVISGTKNAVFSKSNLPEPHPNITFTGYLNNQSLISCYQKAEIFISLSFDEGFGIPALEASRFGCKLLLSDIQVYRELYDRVATFAAPDNTQDCADQIIALTQKKLDNEAYTHELFAIYSYPEAAKRLMQLIDAFF